VAAEVRFAIVGSGGIGGLHAEVLGRIDGARLVAVADVDSVRAGELAQRHGVEARDVDAVLGAPDIDAVCVCTPNGLHAAIGERAASFGKHVLVEKPIDVTLDAADRLIDACAQSGVQLGVISQHRFDDATVAIKQAIQDGRLGTPLFAASVTRWWREQSYYDTVPWRGTLELDGGALLNQGAHHIELLLWLLGPVTRVYARYATVAHDMEAEDLALLTLDFASGALATVEVTTAAYPGFPERLSVTGANGTVAIEGTDLSSWDLRGSEMPALEAGGAVGASDPAAIGSESHRLQIADFAAAVREDRAPAVSGEDGRRALEVMLAARESHRSGQPVAIGTMAVSR
jgi:predicted dehydrogenase